MKFLVLCLAVASIAYGKVLEIPDNHSAYGYLENSIKEGERIRQLEESSQSSARIVGGTAASLGQYPFQAGLLINLIGIESGRGICGGSLISNNRVITAAHCWFDGVNQGWRVEVVLGSVTLFTSGTRVFSSVVINHPDWFPLLVRNDVAVIYLPNAVQLSNNIAPIALPSGSEIQEDYTGLTAFASGFGLTEDGGSIASNQHLSRVTLRVISNAICRLGFPLVLHESNICTSGIGGQGTCQGDSGGPLVINRNGRPLLIGVTSFGSALGCQTMFPAAFARVTSFIDFFNSHL